MSPNADTADPLDDIEAAVSEVSIESCRDDGRSLQEREAAAFWELRRAGLARIRRARRAPPTPLGGAGGGQ